MGRGSTEEAELVCKGRYIAGGFQIVAGALKFVLMRPSTDKTITPPKAIVAMGVLSFYQRGL
jgi:hypothetical protein